MKLRTILLLSLAMTATAEKRAKNVILLLADAGGTSTLHAASIHGYGDTRKLFIQSMPHIGLSDTSTASNWVSDSAAGMTAIVAGAKTHNGVLSQSSKAVRGKEDGEPLKTILEHAEERGLSTGVITNRPFYDATPAACYAQVNSRGATAKILEKFLAPRFGDGVDILIGTGRKQALAVYAGFLGDVAKKGYAVLSAPGALETSQSRVVAVVDEKFELGAVMQKAIDILSRNKKGYFLMVEWDAHTDNPKAGLDNVVEFDKAIRRTAERPDTKDTLMLFTADHSFDLRMVGGVRGRSLLDPVDPAKPYVKKEGSHTGEEVLVAARGPGASRVRGYMDNTELFGVMMAAYGWSKGK